MVISAGRVVPHTGALVAVRRQSNRIVERWQRTTLDENFRVEGRRTCFEIIEEMQVMLALADAAAVVPRRHSQAVQKGGDHPQVSRPTLPQGGYCQVITVSVHSSRHRALLRFFRSRISSPR